ncbi:hypothetical protein [Methanolobus sp.]|uniref:hypothetical protein n=1 Tax=Methanolobus sp. TaxID=1874737 RepID=UPI0025F065CA|nr:hypothetical protein [Methanolobus sp.]
MKSKTIAKKSEPDSPVVAPKDDDDADYKPILRGVINTRCNYDGGKVEGNQD